MNGYEEMHPVGIDVRADMLESVAGLTDAEMEGELAFATNTYDWNDPASMRWLAALTARRIATVEADAKEGAPA